jgi:hypothetical protein
VAGCAGGPRPTPPAESAGVAPGTLVMVIRHGEKPDGSHPGVDAQGNQDDSSLTETGWERANRLVRSVRPGPGSAPTGAGHAEGRSTLPARTTPGRACGPGRPSCRWRPGSASP